MQYVITKDKFYFTGNSFSPDINQAVVYTEIPKTNLTVEELVTQYRVYYRDDYLATLYDTKEEAEATFVHYNNPFYSIRKILSTKPIMKKFVIRCKKTNSPNSTFFWQSEKFWYPQTPKIFNSKEDAEKEMPAVNRLSSLRECANIEIAEFIEELPETDDQKDNQPPWCAIFVLANNPAKYYCEHEMWRITPHEIALFSSKEIAITTVGTSNTQFITLPQVLELYQKEHMNVLKTTLDQKLKTYRQQFIVVMKKMTDDALPLFLNSRKQWTFHKDQAEVFNDKADALQFSGIFSEVVDVIVNQTEKWIIKCGSFYLCKNKTWVKEMSDDVLIYSSQQQAENQLALCYPNKNVSIEKLPS